MICMRVLLKIVLDETSDTSVYPYICVLCIVCSMCMDEGANVSSGGCEDGAIIYMEEGAEINSRMRRWDICFHSLSMIVNHCFFINNYE